MNNQKTDIKDVIYETVPQERDDKYNDYVDENTPKVSWMINLCKAFLVGGIICTLGQGLISFYMYLGLDKETAALYNTLSLIFLSVVLTGLSIYPKIANFAGAGTLVPITGFANSVAAPAIEFKKEGWVFGVGCKIFTIAGPVILYGVVTSWVLGLIYWIGKDDGSCFHSYSRSFPFLALYTSLYWRFPFFRETLYSERPSSTDRRAEMILLPFTSLRAFFLIPDRLTFFWFWME